VGGGSVGGICLQYERQLRGGGHLAMTRPVIPPLENYSVVLVVGHEVCVIRCPVVPVFGFRL